MFRCLNCQETLKLDGSIAEKYPEWPALTARQRGASAVSLARAGLVASTSAEGAREARSHSAAAPTARQELRSLGASAGNLGHLTTMQGNLFDIISNDATPLEHPLCQDCTDRLLDCMDEQLRSLEDECADYGRLLDELRSPAFGASAAAAAHFDTGLVRAQLGTLRSEECALMEELKRLESEEAELDKQLARELSDGRQANKEEERLWRVYHDQTRKLLELEQDEESVQNQLRHVSTQLERLSKTNIFNLTFHIWHRGHFGTINGFRLGRLPDVPVEWTEINAAWGQTVLLLKALSSRVNLKFERYQPVPFGNSPLMKCLDPESKDKELPLYCTGGYKLLGHSKFDSAMVAFLDCLRQLQQHIEKSGGFCLPYPMQKDKIVAEEKEFSVKLQFNSDERWTKSMKCLLTNLKWALAWVASLH